MLIRSLLPLLMVIAQSLPATPAAISHTSDSTSARETTPLLDRMKLPTITSETVDVLPAIRPFREIVLTDEDPASVALAEKLWRDASHTSLPSASSNTRKNTSVDVTSDSVLFPDKQHAKYEIGAETRNNIGGWVGAVPGVYTIGTTRYYYERSTTSKNRDSIPKLVEESVWDWNVPLYYQDSWSTWIEVTPTMATVLLTPTGDRLLSKKPEPVMMRFAVRTGNRQEIEVPLSAVLKAEGISPDALVQQMGNVGIGKASIGGAVGTGRFWIVLPMREAEMSVVFIYNSDFRLEGWRVYHGFEVGGYSVSSSVTAPQGRLVRIKRVKKEHGFVNSVGEESVLMDDLANPQCRFVGASGSGSSFRNIDSPYYRSLDLFTPPGLQSSLFFDSRRPGITPRHQITIEHGKITEERTVPNESKPAPSKPIILGGLWSPPWLGNIPGDRLAAYYHQIRSRVFPGITMTIRYQGRRP